MKTIAALTIASLSVVAGCASSLSRGSTTSTEPASGVALDLQTTGDLATPTFPSRIDSPETPRQANRLASRVVAELGGEARADLKLCVDGAGKVARVDVAKSSGIEELDAAFTAEAKTWRYQALSVSDATVCQKVEIAYRVAR